MTAAIVFLLAWNILLSIELFYQRRAAKRVVKAGEATDDAVCNLDIRLVDLGKAHTELTKALHTHIEAFSAHQYNHEYSRWMTFSTPARGTSRTGSTDEMVAHRLTPRRRAGRGRGRHLPTRHLRALRGAAVSMLVPVTGVGSAGTGYMSTHEDWCVAVGAAQVYARHCAIRHVVYRIRDPWMPARWRVAPAYLMWSGWLRRRAEDLERTGHDWRTTR
jgi:hypothetical protein